MPRPDRRLRPRCPRARRDGGRAPPPRDVRRLRRRARRARDLPALLDLAERPTRSLNARRRGWRRPCSTASRASTAAATHRRRPAASRRPRTVRTRSAGARTAAPLHAPQLLPSRLRPRGHGRGRAIVAVSWVSGSSPAAATATRRMLASTTPSLLRRPSSQRDRRGELYTGTTGTKVHLSVDGLRPPTGHVYTTSCGVCAARRLEDQRRHVPCRRERPRRRRASPPPRSRANTTS